MNNKIKLRLYMLQLQHESEQFKVKLGLERLIEAAQSALVDLEKGPPPHLTFLQHVPDIVSAGGALRALTTALQLMESSDDEEVPDANA